MERLYDIAASGDVKALRQLLEKDPFLLERVSYTNPNNTLLHIAATKGNLPFVEEILRLNPHLAEELNSQQSSPLHMASARGHVEIAKKLADAAPDMCLSLDSQGRNPLHLAAIKGHIELLKELISRAPDMCLSLDSQGRNPLHLAAIKGHIELLKELVSRAPDMCLSLDSQGRNPLHLAAIKGHIELLKELVSRAPLAARERVGRGLTVLHLCVKHSKLEALKFLVNEVNELINAKNDDGDTILHTAVMGKKVETVKYLVSVEAVEVNAVNDEGITALDILNRSRRDWMDSDIEKSLKKAGGFEILGKNMKHSYSSSSTSFPPGLRESLTKSSPGWVQNKKSSLMVVASLIATMAFQIGVDPPTGVWKNNKSAGSQATYVVVGDSLGWRVPNTPDYYSNWASRNVIRVGDVLVFNFMTGEHDVAQVTKAGFDECSSSNPIISPSTVGPWNITINSTGEHYFICTFGTHCSLGQKLAIYVTAPTPVPDTMPFQIGGVTPPAGGVWKNKEESVDSQGKLVSTIHLDSPPSPSQYSHNHYDAAAPSPSQYSYNHYRVSPASSASFYEIPICILFYSVNTTAFVASLSIILLLMSGLPIRHGIFMWILMAITWIAIVAIALCYVIVIRVVAVPTGEVDSVAFVILFTAAVWIILTAFLSITHTIRIIVRIIKCIKRAWKRKMRLRRSSGGSTGPAGP